MATTTETPEQVMTAQRWFDEGGQETELQRIGTIKNAEQRKIALQQFNEQNNNFMAERSGQRQPPPLPERPEKAKTHPAIEAAINETKNREPGWMRDITGMSDDQLRERYLERAMKQDGARNRLNPGVLTLSEYKENRPDLVEFAGKYTREELERKDILSRMIQDRRFNVSKAKIDWERKQNPELVKIAERNLTDRNFRQTGPKYNDALYSEVSQVKRTLGNAKAVGFKS
jgi:hypothetical protein